MNSQQDISKELPKQMVQDAKNFRKVHSIVFDLLHKLMMAPGKGNVLEYRDEERVIYLGVKELKTVGLLWEEFTRSLPNNIKELRRKKKTVRAKLQPESLRNVYIPVYVTEPLRDFFMNNPQGFGGALTREISEHFESGYMLRMTINTLFHLYANQNKLQDPSNKQYINFDSHMRECFANTQVGFVNVVKGDKKIKVPAAEAKVRATTVDVIRQQEETNEDIISGKRKPISKDGCYTFHFYSITSYNCCSVNSIEKFDRPQEFKKVFDDLQDIEVQKGMLSDFARIKRVSDSLNPKMAAKRVAENIKSPNRSPNRSAARSPRKDGGTKSPSRLMDRTAAASPSRLATRTSPAPRRVAV